jgi:hypothetical protein
MSDEVRIKTYESQIAIALPAGSLMTSERMGRTAITAVRLNLKCTRESLYGSIIRAAQLGLSLDKLGEIVLKKVKMRKYE